MKLQTHRFIIFLTYLAGFLFFIFYPCNSGLLIGSCAFFVIGGWILTLTFGTVFALLSSLMRRKLIKREYTDRTSWFIGYTICYLLVFLSIILLHVLYVGINIAASYQKQVFQQESRREKYERIIKANYELTDFLESKIPSAGGQDSGGIEIEFNLKVGRSGNYRLVPYIAKARTYGSLPTKLFIPSDSFTELVSLEEDSPQHFSFNLYADKKVSVSEINGPYYFELIVIPDPKIRLVSFDKGVLLCSDPAMEEEVLFQDHYVVYTEGLITESYSFDEFSPTLN